MSGKRYRPVNLGQAIDNQGRYRQWVAKQAGISPTLLTLAIKGERTLGEDTARRIADLLQLPFFVFFESAIPETDEGTAEMEQAA